MKLERYACLLLAPVMKFIRKHAAWMLAFWLLSSIPATAGTLRVLFLGNSYTYVNDLPGMIADVAASAGDTLITSNNTPGGQNLGGHLGDPVSLNLIRSGGFDFVVLQEQSMRPSQPDDWVTVDFFRNAHKLDSIINLYNPCGETMFYMTWGYRDGNPGFCQAYPWWPYLCTYEVMDSLTNLRYCMVADSNNAVVSPVGAVRRYLRTHYPSIELYDTDGSHPSLAGTYAAACCFYTSLFRKSPANINYQASLHDSIVLPIYEAVTRVVYDSLLKWNIGQFDNTQHDSCKQQTGASPALAFFPNPASEVVNLALPQGVDDGDLFVYNVHGALVRKIAGVNGAYFQITTDNMPAGLYFIRLYQDDNLAGTGRFIVVHK